MQRVASRIEAVTVYRAGALVSRAAELEAGDEGFPQKVQIGDLPLGLDDGSVRVRVLPSGDEAVAPGTLPEAVDARVALDVPGAGGEAAAVEPEELEQARREEARVRDLLALCERELERLDGLAPPLRPQNEPGQAPPTVPLDKRLALLEFRTARTRALRERRRGLAEELREAAARRQELEERERRASTARAAKEHELRKSVVVGLRAGSATAPVRLVLEYLVPGARWAPAYSIHFDADLGQAELSMRAVVCQRTGEDWSDVALSLSTAQAQRWTELPELRSIRIGRRQPAVARTGWRPPPVGASGLYADYDRAFGPGTAGAKAAPLAVSRDSGEDITEKVLAPDDAGGAPPAEAWSEEDEEATGELEVAEYARSSEIRFDEDKTDPARPVPSMPVLAAMSRGAPGGPPPPPSMPPGPPGPPLSPGAPAAQGFVPAPPGHAVTRAKRRRSERDTLLFGGGGGGVGLVLQVADEPELTVADELLAYGHLRMPPAGDSRRGSLVSTDLAERYLALLAEVEVRVEVNVLAAVRRATARAREADRAPLPPRHLAPPIDGFDYAYRADAPAEIPSDGAFHSVPLSHHRVPARARYVVVPRESLDAFRFAELETPAGAPLLPGPADVYVGEDFLVTTDVRGAPPRANLPLGLGVEQGIKVSRNTSFDEKTTGLMRGSLNLRHDVRVEVANRLERPALVEVRERIPVKAVEDDDDIEVAVVEVAPAWEPYDQSQSPIRGGYVWEVEVAPGAERSLRASYEVRIAAKNELVGGNRRES
ncbi:mucoidy inhibitor MuiA family protein [Haliangium sp.]|uniref:mucoidy inhibitor MuiA family protein n=1 Tax=Haliangium sp. TaxID=2663208 RepID=UPI003D0F0B07